MLGGMKFLFSKWMQNVIDKLDETKAGLINLV